GPEVPISHGPQTLSTRSSALGGKPAATNDPQTPHLTCWTGTGGPRKRVGPSASRADQAGLRGSSSAEPPSGSHTTEPGTVGRSDRIADTARRPCGPARSLP